MGSLGCYGWGKDEHVEVEEEPTKWSGVDGVGVGFRDGMDCVCLELEEIGLVSFFEMLSPSGTEVWGVVVSSCHNEGNAAVPEIVIV